MPCKWASLHRGPAGEPGGGCLPKFLREKKTRLNRSELDHAHMQSQIKACITKSSCADYTDKMT